MVCVKRLSTALRSRREHDGRAGPAGPWGLYRSSFDERWTRWVVPSLVAGVPVLAGVGTPLLVREIFDSALPDQDRAALAWLCAGLVVLQVSSAASMIATTRWVAGRAREAGSRLRVRLAEWIQGQEIASLDAIGASRLHDKVVRDVERVDQMGVSLLAQAVPSLVLVMASLLILFLVDWVLLTVLVAAAPGLWMLTNRLARHVRSATEALHRSEERLSAATLLSISILRLTRARGAESVEVQRHADLAADHAGIGRRRDSSQPAMVLTIRSMVGVVAFLILFVGGARVISGASTIGSMFGFFGGLAVLRIPLDSLIYAVPNIIAGRASLIELDALLREGRADPYRGGEVGEFAGSVRLEGVGFGYDARPVIEDVDLELVPGQVTALVGPNGSGKTTLANLVLGLYRPSTGRVLADGKPYDELDMATLRRSMGIVFQDALLFDDTISANLTYGSVEVGSGELERVAVASTADRVVRNTWGGFDARVGPDGARLSGGERQRLSIARALMGTPKLLVLDEPSNHLDRQSLRRLCQNLRDLPGSPAVLLISHDPEITDLADRTYAIEAGRVAPVTGPSEAVA